MKKNYLLKGLLVMALFVFGFTQQSNAQCTAGYTYTQSSATINFTNTSVGPPGSFLVYNWDFGDGNFGYNTNETHTYAANGTYLACLTMWDSASLCTDTYCDSILVTGLSTNCAVTAAAASQGGGTYNFSATPTGTAPFTYSWTFGDGNTSTAAAPSHTYASSGTYTYCVTITDANSCTSSDCGTAIVAPNCSVSITSITQSGAAATFFTSTAGIPPFTYSWTFGDGGTSTALLPTHTYSANGGYIVCVTMTDANSCTSTYCDSILVTGVTTSCAANFSSSLSSGTALFTNTSTGPYTSTSWTFGDGGASTAASPSHTYAANGTYQVCLTVSGPGGCSDTYCSNVVVTGLTTLYNIAGGLFLGTTPMLDDATVYLIKFDPITNILSLSDSVILTVGDSGYYYFGGLVADNYRVKAALNATNPNYANYVPTYYGNQLNWLNASVITVGPNSWSNDINLINGINPGGPGFIGGNVSLGANKKAGPGDPVEGAQVMLLDMNDQAIAYVYSDANGEFSFDNLAYGTYQVYTEVLGKETVPAIVTIGPDAPSVDDIDVRIGSTNVSTGINNLTAQGVSNNVKLYPNPVNGAMNLEIDSDKSQRISLSVVNGIGQIVWTDVATFSAGTSTVSNDFSFLPNGLYTLIMSSEDGSRSSTLKFAKQ